MKIICFVGFLMVCVSLPAQNIVHPYAVAQEPWEESFGNHRAVLEIDTTAIAIDLELVWRRHDKNPEKRQFIIIRSEDGDTIKNIHRGEINNERCALTFGPVERKGTYYFYYLPHIVQEEYGFYNHPYPREENSASLDWLTKIAKNSSTRPRAKVKEIQSRTSFDHFYPMEVVALQTEKQNLKNLFKDAFLLFPEDRQYPIRMLDDLPARWIQHGPSQQFTGQAQKNEYYSFQIGVYALHQDLTDVKVSFSSLRNHDSEISVERFTCFNTGGIDPYGRPFVKQVDLIKDHVQPLWIGIDIPRDVASGTYQGQIEIQASNDISKTIDVALNISDEVLSDRGDSELWRHSRLRWLNSTLGIDDRPTQAFQDIERLGENKYRLTNKELIFNDHAFPMSLRVGDVEILQEPMSFNIISEEGKEVFSSPQKINALKNASGVINNGWESTSPNFHLMGQMALEADGYLNYSVTIKAKKPQEVSDIFLQIPIEKQIAKYMMGMGLPGTVVPDAHQSKWEGPHDSFWIGSADAGIWCELRGGDYHGPLLNLFRPAYPATWHNSDRGGFKIKQTSQAVNVIVSSGSTTLSSGEELTFEWSLLLTPVKSINYESQFSDRYYHNGGDPMPTDEDISRGVRVVNLHHANNYNPHINYPFLAIDSLKWFVEQMHQRDQKVKIYYTIRELTNYTPEIWALRSLGYEILGQGRGGGHPWLQEHLVSGYRPQWYQWFPNKSPDASVVNSADDSRWYNYYIEGLAWLVKNVDIDGLYLDDVSYDRRTVKRIRKVLDDLKPGCLLDLHSNTGFSKGPATQYAEYFPYLDKLWFGESFDYDQMSPENWLVEVSGIPFGHMGDMLHGGGNRWLGMLFGMTVRHPWVTEGVKCDPRPVWQVWDSFGIQDAKMFGFWEDDLLVLTDHPDVKATAYLKEDRMLISLGNWAEEQVSTTVTIHWDLLHQIQPDQGILQAPAIKDFQPSAQFKLQEPITIDPKKGWLLILEF